MNDGKLTLTVHPNGRKRHPIIEASVNGRVVHRDGLNVDDAGERQKFIDAIRATCPAVNADGCNAELLAMPAMKRSAEHQSSNFKPRLLRMSDVESKPIRWLWPGRIAAGRLSLLVGMGGVGKSFLTADMAARITTGRAWPDGSLCERGSVLFLTAEDDPADTIRPRLDAHGADVNRVALLTGAYDSEADDDDDVDMMISLGHVDIIEAALRQMEDCRLMVIDPIGSFLGGQTDSHRDNEVRSVLAPIGKLAEKYGPAVLAIAHRRKSVGSVADDMALGSRAFTAIARSVYHLSADSEDKERRLLLPGKTNIGPKLDGLAFRIVGEPAAIVWDDDPVTMTADEALAKEHGAKDGGYSAVDEAEAWLREALEGGPVGAKEIIDAAKSVGINERTLYRAKKTLSVSSKPMGFGKPRVWRLPDAIGTDAGDSLASLGQSRQELITGETDETGARLDGGGDGTDDDFGTDDTERVRL